MRRGWLLALVFVFSGCKDDSSSSATDVPEGGVLPDGGTTTPGGDSGPTGTPGTACGLKYGTKFIYAVGESVVLKVHLDGEIDEKLGSIARDGTNTPTYPGGLLFEAQKILIVGGRTSAGTPNPGWWEGAWPQGDGFKVDVATLAFTGNANEGPLRSMANFIVATNGGAGVFKVDLDTHATTMLTNVTMPAYYYITEFLDVTPSAFTFLASIAPATGTNNRAFTSSLNGATWTTAENTSQAIATDAPIIAVRHTDDGKALWFDKKGFYIAGTRVRDVHYCENAMLRPAVLSGVEQ